MTQSTLRPGTFRHALLALAALVVLAALCAVGCDETIRVPNRAPVATLDALEPDGEVLGIFYRLFDLDGDDVEIELVVCQGSTCQTATAAPGGDGTTNLPTNPDEPVLHLFRWAAGCDLAGSDFDAELVVRILPSDSDDGVAAESESFVLSELGVTEACATEE